MTEATLFLPGLSPVGGKEITATFDGGQLSSDGGVLILREIERHLGIATKLSACVPDARDPSRVSTPCRHGPGATTHRPRHGGSRTVRAHAGIMCRKFRSRITAPRGGCRPRRPLFGAPAGTKEFTDIRRILSEFRGAWPLGPSPNSENHASCSIPHSRWRTLTMVKVDRAHRRHIVALACRNCWRD